MDTGERGSVVMIASGRVEYDLDSDTVSFLSFFKRVPVLKNDSWNITCKNI